MAIDDIRGNGSLDEGMSIVPDMRPLLLDLYRAKQEEIDLFREHSRQLDAFVQRDTDAMGKRGRQLQEEAQQSQAQMRRQATIAALADQELASRKKIAEGVLRYAQLQEEAKTDPAKSQALQVAQGKMAMAGFTGALAVAAKALQGLATILQIQNVLYRGESNAQEAMVRGDPMQADIERQRASNEATRRALGMIPFIGGALGEVAAAAGEKKLSAMERFQKQRRLFNEQIDDLAQVSGQIATVKAQMELAKLGRRFQTANVMGGQLAAMAPQMIELENIYRQASFEDSKNTFEELRETAALEVAKRRIQSRFGDALGSSWLGEQFIGMQAKKELESMDAKKTADSISQLLNKIGDVANQGKKGTELLGGIWEAIKEWLGGGKWKSPLEELIGMTEDMMPRDEMHRGKSPEKVIGVDRPFFKGAW